MELCVKFYIKPFYMHITFKFFYNTQKKSNTLFGR